MLNQLNMIRAAFRLPKITKLASGNTNREIIENTLQEGSKLKFSAGTNWIDIDGEIYSNSLQTILDRLKSDGFTVWTSEGMPVIKTPNEISDFLSK